MFGWKHRSVRLRALRDIKDANNSGRTVLFLKLNSMA
jgi:hypothetical protein